MSTVALKPQPPELAGAGGAGTVARRKPPGPSGQTPLTRTTLTDATATRPTPITTQTGRTAPSTARTAPEHARTAGTTRVVPTGAWSATRAVAESAATVNSAVRTSSRSTAETIAAVDTDAATGPRVSLTSATSGRVPVRSCAGVEVGWQPVADRPPLRLTRRGRMVVASVTFLVFGAAILVLGLRAAGALSDGPRFSETTSVQVGAGQNLWSIAVETNPDQDPRIVIDEIVKINGLRHAGDVVPGQTLVVPRP